MDLRINDQAPVGLGGRLARALRRQDRDGAKGTRDKAASRLHGSILSQVRCDGVRRRHYAIRLCDFPTPGHNSMPQQH
jgi:hypothetical protein